MNYYGPPVLDSEAFVLDLAMGCFVEFVYIKGMGTVFRASVPAAIANICVYNRSNDS